MEEADEYWDGKAAIIEPFKPQVQPDDIIRQAIAAKLRTEYFIVSLRQIDRLYEKAKSNIEAKCGLVWSARLFWNILTWPSLQYIMDRQVMVILSSMLRISGMEGWHFILPLFMLQSTRLLASLSQLFSFKI